MMRVLGFLFFAALAVLLYLLPAPRPYDLAALEAGSLLEEEVGSEPPAGWQAGLAPDDRVECLDGWRGRVEDRTAAGLVLRGEGGERRTVAEAELGRPLVPLWRRWIDGPHATRGSTGSVTVRISGSLVRQLSPPEAVDVHAHGEALHSVVRRLRTLCQEEKIELAVEGQIKPYTGAEPKLGLLLLVEQGKLRLELGDTGAVPLAWAEKEWYPPRQSSLFPPLVTILLAVLLRRPVLSLAVGVLLGSMLVLHRGGASLGTSLGGGLLDTFRVYARNELTSPDRLYIIAFVVFMLAMVGIMTKSGGIRGLMDRIARVAGSVRRTQVAAWLMGLAVFFDDYANTILVGSTMRPLTDRLKIAREKLAYIVDSTAAPVAGVSIFSTWIAYEVSTFSAQLPDAGLSIHDGYAVFLQTLPYRFYCYFTLVLVGLVALTGRDFGPMLRAERRARGGELVRAGGKPLSGGEGREVEAAAHVVPKASRALLPLVLFIGLTLFEIGRSGYASAIAAGSLAPGESLFGMKAITILLYEGSGSKPLMVGSGAGLLLALLLGWLAGLRTELAQAAWSSLRSMGIAITILYLAWMIGAICRDAGTAAYLTVLLGDALNPLLLPCILFVLSGVVAFSTGSSWSTMSILLPLVVGLAFGLGNKIEGLGGHALMILSIGAVLEGAIFGDHCSPISDTTLMSSIATGSDHIDHVRTQMPYAILCMLVAMLAGYFPCTFLGMNPFLGIALGSGLLALFLFVFGRRIDAREAEARA